MRVECFLDTNIFIYLFDNTDAHKRGIAEELVKVNCGVTMPVSAIKWCRKPSMS